MLSTVDPSVHKDINVSFEGYCPVKRGDSVLISALVQEEIPIMQIRDVVASKITLNLNGSPVAEYHGVV
ncbi:MAG: hypothetical protein ABH817_00505 [archaeon]